MRLFGVGAIVVSVSLGVSADEGLIPGVDYDPRIPTLEAVVGHAFGEEITAPYQIESYLRALAAAAPDRARFLPYGESWEARTLAVLVLGSPERLARPFPVPFEYGEGVVDEFQRPDSTSGLVRTVVESDHWLGSGTDGELDVMVSGRRIFAPIAFGEGFNVASFDNGPLAGNPALIHQPIGRGHVIAFTEDPNAYGFMESTELLFMNAVLLGSAHLPPP